MTSADQIIDLYETEGWHSATIADELDVPHGFVLRVILPKRQGVFVNNPKPKIPRIEPEGSFIHSQEGREALERIAQGYEANLPGNRPLRSDERTGLFVNRSRRLLLSGS